MSSETEASRSQNEVGDVEKGTNDSPVVENPATETEMGGVETTTTSTELEAPENAPEREIAGNSEVEAPEEDEDEDGFPVPQDRARGRMVGQVAGPPKSSGRPR